MNQLEEQWKTPAGKGEELPPNIHESWHSYLLPLFNDKKMLLMKYEILPKGKFYPKKEDIFNVFKMPMDKIRVVILGQDPYKNEGEAIGYAFSVAPDTPAPGSLRILRKEVLGSKAPLDTHTSPNSLGWKTLAHWRMQGVFLLNTALTVEAGKSNTHIGFWNWFTKGVVHAISLEAKDKPVWLLWGARAKSFKGNIHSYYGWNGAYMGSSYNYVLEADHPAAELYPDSKYKFTGCNHFNLCNQILTHKGLNIINW